jgi:hypothetical protein
MLRPPASVPYRVVLGVAAGLLLISGCASRRPDWIEATLVTVPFELRSGDRWTDPEGREWEVTGRPTAYKQGKMTSVRLQKPGEPNVIDVQYWDAHERIRVRRG